MSHIPAEIIRKKRDGVALSRDELQFFVTNFLADKISEGQMGAFLMAVTLKGMTMDETASMTELSRDSGQIFKWPQWQSLVVDKHSTGGVGDKTSMVLLPLCLLEGLKVPMMAGRGLGHTGGTIDKLESVPGMRVRLTDEEVENMMTVHGGVLMGQTENIVPLDYRLYHLRDVTATIESIPLIVTSILSKKLAEGVKALVMDIKFGSGAFMQDLPQARELSHWLIEVGKRCGLTVRCVLSNMGSPLGRTAGNALEIKECIDVLHGAGPQHTRELSVELAAHMVQMVHPHKNLEKIKQQLCVYLENGKAWQVFKNIMGAQGAKVEALEDVSLLPKAKYTEHVFAPHDGYVSEINVRKLGLSTVVLGGGRLASKDKIDHAVGLSQMTGLGEFRKSGDILCSIESNDQQKLQQAKTMVAEAYQFSDKPKVFKLIEEVIS